MPKTVHDILLELADILEPPVVAAPVAEAFATSGDWVIDRPGIYGPGTHTGHIIVNAPRVVFDHVVATGSTPERNVVECYGDGFTLSHSTIWGGPKGQKRGLYLEASDCNVADSAIGNIVYQGNGDTQAIGAVRKAHRLRVTNSILEAAGEVVMAGGDTIGAAEDMCSDWRFDNVTFRKNLAWRAVPGTAKNIFELKAIDGCVCKDCTFEHSWVDAQTGFGIVLTVRNQNGKDPFATVRNVTFEDCLLKGVAGGVSILGRDDSAPSVPMENVTFKNFRIEDISPDTWGGNGRTFQILGGPKNLTLDNVTVVRGAGVLNSAIMFDQPQFPLDGFVVRQSTFNEGEYGIHGGVLGTPALAAYAPSYVWEGNTIVKGGQRVIPYPAGTTLI